MRWLPVFLALGTLLLACDPNQDDACVAAGGTCFFGGGCVKLAPSNEQDCNGTLSCCLLFVDAASTPQDSGAVSASACASTGGTCVIGPGNGCAKEAPASAQDCDPSGNPGGGVCCLTFFDASAPQDSGDD